VFLQSRPVFCSWAVVTSKYIFKRHATASSNRSSSRHATCLEGALKIKEISYMHSEGSFVFETFYFWAPIEPSGRQVSLLEN